MQHEAECGSKRTRFSGSQPTVNKNAVKQVFLCFCLFYAEETNPLVSKKKNYTDNYLKNAIKHRSVDERINVKLTDFMVSAGIILSGR